MHEIREKGWTSDPEEFENIEMGIGAYEINMYEV
jgi:hypothetical protein